MKYLLLFLLTGCIKNVPCNQKVKLQIGWTLNNPVHYVNVDIGYPEPYTYGVYYENLELFKTTVDITDRLVGGKTIVRYSFFAKDGSYDVINDTILIK